jgi:hypothetical protein
MRDEREMRALRSLTAGALLAASMGAPGCVRSPASPPGVASPSVASVACARGGNGIEIAEPQALPPEALAGADVDPDADLILPCKAGTPEHSAAKTDLSALADAIRDVADDGDPQPAVDQLTALLETTCFALNVGEATDGLDFDSAVSLKTWWDDGGESWVEHYLDIADRRATVIPPSPRRSLTTAKPAGKRAKTPKKAANAAATPNGPHPLSPLLCSAADARSSSTTGCGHETTGWALRADRDLTRRAAGQTWKLEEACAKEAAAMEPNERFAGYRDCLDEVAIRRTALPLGRFKAPTDGWFVVSGPRRRGCVELSTYDLATGAAYTVSECTPRSGRAGQSSSPVLALASGKIPLPLLREAAWMIMMAPVAQTGVRVDATSFEVPAAIAIERVSGTLRGIGASSRCGGSGTPRSWSWMREKNGVLVGQASGLLRWPIGIEDAESHAAELLEIAEDGIELGCAPAAAPARITWTSPGPAIERGQPATLEDPALLPLQNELAKPTIPRLLCLKR